MSVLVWTTSSNLLDILDPSAPAPRALCKVLHDQHLLPSVKPGRILQRHSWLQAAAGWNGAHFKHFEAALKIYKTGLGSRLESTTTQVSCFIRGPYQLCPQPPVYALGLRAVCPANCSWAISKASISGVCSNLGTSTRGLPFITCEIIKSDKKKRSLWTNSLHHSAPRQRLHCLQMSAPWKVSKPLRTSRVLSSRTLHSPIIIQYFHCFHFPTLRTIKRFGSSQRLQLPAPLPGAAPCCARRGRWPGRSPGRAKPRGLPSPHRGSDAMDQNRDVVKHPGFWWKEMKTWHDDEKCLKSCSGTESKTELLSSIASLGQKTHSLRLPRLHARHIYQDKLYLALIPKKQNSKSHRNPITATKPQSLSLQAFKTDSGSLLTLAPWQLGYVQIPRPCAGQSVLSATKVAIRRSRNLPRDNYLVCCSHWMLAL